MCKKYITFLRYIFFPVKQIKHFLVRFPEPLPVLCDVDVRHPHRFVDVTEAVVDDGFVDSGRIGERRPSVACTIECQIFLDSHQLACSAQSDRQLGVQDFRENLLVEAQRALLLWSCYSQRKVKNSESKSQQMTR